MCSQLLSAGVDFLPHPLSPATPKPQFPKELEEQVARAVHHSLLPLEALVTRIYDSLRPPAPAEAAAGEAAAAPAAEAGAPAAPAAAAAAAAAAPEASPLAEKENGAAQPPAGGEGAAPAEAAEGAAAAGGKASTAKKPRPPKAPVARGLLRTFIVEHAAQQGPEGGKAQVRPPPCLPCSGQRAAVLRWHRGVFVFSKWGARLLGLGPWQGYEGGRKGTGQGTLSLSLSHSPSFPPCLPAFLPPPARSGW